MFCQRPIVSNVISAVLDHLKPIFFFAYRSWWITYSAPPPPPFPPTLFKISGSTPGVRNNKSPN